MSIASISQFETFVARVLTLYGEGAELYSILENSRTEDMDIIVCPMHLGDTLWIATYAKAYKKYHGCGKMLFVVNEAQETLPGLFPSVDATLPITPSQMESLKLYIGINRLWYNSNIRYAHFQFDIQITEDALFFLERSRMHSIGHKHIAMRLSRCNILDLPEDSEMEAASIDNVPDVEIYEKYKNAVLLMPAAQTQLGAVSASFWNKLALRLSEKGYDVYCNYNGLSYEMMIENTVPLASGLIEIARNSRLFKRCIGFRSGLCDLLAFAHAPLVVIHPKDDNVQTMDINRDSQIVDNIFQLTEDEGIQSFQYRPEWEDGIIENIIRAL